MPAATSHCTLPPPLSLLAPALPAGCSDSRQPWPAPRGLQLRGLIILVSPLPLSNLFWFCTWTEGGAGNSQRVSRPEAAEASGWGLGLGPEVGGQCGAGRTLLISCWVLLLAPHWHLVFFDKQPCADKNNFLKFLGAPRARSNGWVSQIQPTGCILPNPDLEGDFLASHFLHNLSSYLIFRNPNLINRRKIFHIWNNIELSSWICYQMEKNNSCRKPIISNEFRPCWGCWARRYNCVKADDCVDKDGYNAGIEMDFG